MTKILDNFIFEDIRERFYYEKEEDRSGWTHTHVKVFDKTVSTTDPIYEYDRNYSMLKTFEPFRVWDESCEQWRHFALISPQYVNFEVLDLDNHEIWTKNPPLLLSQEKADFLNENKDTLKWKAGDDFSHARFCPMEFHVPDPLDILDSRDTEEFKEYCRTRNSDGVIVSSVKDNVSNDDKEFWVEWLENFSTKRSFGFEAGCVWGDDWSRKLQAIDISKILDKEVSDDNRFGYFVLQSELKDVYSKDYYDDDEINRFTLLAPIEIYFDKEDDKKIARSSLLSEIPNFEGTKF